ncbi:Cytochrome P450 71C4 [Hordeum vulgare]|nr:Cytochrome P450 71C4 [Hordeum vulgare]
MAGFSAQNKGKSPTVHPHALPPPASSRRPRHLISVPVHQARWHWEQRIPLPYPDVTLPHDSHLDPDRIPVPVVPRSARTHAEEEVWFVLEHEEQRRRNVRDAQPGPSPLPPVVCDEDREAEAAYQAVLAATLRESEEEEWHNAEKEDATYEAHLIEAIALSPTDDCVVPPPSKTEPRPEVYQWTRGLSPAFVAGFNV